MGSGSGCLRIEVEGLGVVAQGIGGCEGGKSGISGLARVVDRLDEVDGSGSAEPVAGQFTHPRSGSVPVDVFHGLGHLPVGPDPPGGTEVLVQGVLDEGVGEAVMPRSVGQLPHQRRRGGCFEDVEHFVFGRLAPLAPGDRDRSLAR